MDNASARLYILKYGREIVAPRKEKENLNSATRGEHSDLDAVARPIVNEVIPVVGAAPPR